MLRISKLRISILRIAMLRVSDSPIHVTDSRVKEKVLVLVIFRHRSPATKRGRGQFIPKLERRPPHFPGLNPPPLFVHEHVSIDERTHHDH